MRLCQNIGTNEQFALIRVRSQLIIDYSQSGSDRKGQKYLFEISLNIEEDFATNSTKSISSFDRPELIKLCLEKVAPKINTFVVLARHIPDLDANKDSILITGAAGLSGIIFRKAFAKGHLGNWFWTI